MFKEAIVARNFIDELVAQCCVFECFDFLVVRQVCDVLPCRVEGKRVEASLETHENTNGTSGNLGNNVEAVLLSGVELGENCLPHVGGCIVLV